MKSKKEKGFTIIELLISMAVLGMLSTIVVMNFRAGERQQKVRFAGEGIISAIRIAQQGALTGRQIGQSTCTIAGIADKSPTAFIILFNGAGTQTLYATDKCNLPAPSAVGLYTLETYSYPTQVFVALNGLVLDGTPVPALQFKFTPPFGKLTVSSAEQVNEGPFDPFTTATITVQNGTITRTVTIDGVSGRIGL